MLLSNNLNLKDNRKEEENANRDDYAENEEDIEEEFLQNFAGL